MILFRKADELRNYLEVQALKGKRLGFIPTMGALHSGHLSLLETSLRENDLSICSIFVNPTQFNDPADLKNYPVSTEEDIRLLISGGCDILFFPSVEEIYPAGLETTSRFDLGYLETVLEGEYRPGHFQGVCRVVDRLLDIVQPHTLYLGQKDYQQCLVIKKLVYLAHREAIRIVICPTWRQPDGLAESSRNRRLNNKQRAIAPVIFKTLSEIRNEIGAGSLTAIRDNARRTLETHGFRVDYVEIANAETLEPAEHWDGRRKLVALAAVFLDDVRLIDNLLIP